MGDAKRRRLSGLVTAAGEPAAVAEPAPALDRAPCAECYWFEPSHEPGQGFCHGARPQVVVLPQQNKLTGQTAISLQRIFPPVSSADWCGDFEPLEGDEEPPEQEPAPVQPH